MGRLRWLFVFFWLTAVSASAQTFPIQVNADHPGRVLVRVQGQEDEYREFSPTHPAVFQARPGERVDIRVVGRASWWANWAGEQQGCTGPSNVTIRLEKVPAWDRLSGLAVALLGCCAGGLWLWRHRTQKALAEIAHRAEVAESGTGIPKKIAGYRIVKLLGEGGMAHVYHGQDQHGRDFAIKVPKTVDERFQRECVIATTLDSPHIVKAFDFHAEKTPGQPAYMAQEMLLGETLQQRLEDHPQGLPLDQVEELFCQLLDGLEVAHQQGILHRDLKPENLFLDRSRGRELLKILDFGVARADDALLVTVSGAMLGTPIYSSPEQNRSDRLDHRSDLYSAGLVLWEMATGRRTWSAANRYELLKLHNAGLPTEARALRPDLPPEWSALLNDLLRTDPGQRPAQVAEVRTRFLRNRPEHSGS
jgi:hypothetical protein